MKLLSLLIGTMVAVISVAANAQQPPPSSPAPVAAPQAAPMQYVQPAPPANTMPGQAGQPAQQGQQMVTKPPAPAPAVGEGLPREVFNEIVSGALPLSPDQVKSLHKAEDDVKKAHAARPYKMPAPVSRTMTQSLEPGKAPEIVRLEQEFTTTLVFTDSSGAPWLVQKVIPGNKDAVIVPELEGSVGGSLKTPTNIITLSPTDEYVSTNITFLLEGAPAPITMMLVSGQPSLDVRLDVMVRARGPHAQTAAVEGNANTVNLPAEFSAILDGVPPKNARELKTDSPDTFAWVINDKMYVRTSLNLLSPYVYRRAKAPDGTTVYETPEASVVLLMNSGKVASVNISGFPPPALEALRKSLSSN